MRHFSIDYMHQCCLGVTSTCMRGYVITAIDNLDERSMKCRAVSYQFIKSVSSTGSKKFTPTFPPKTPLFALSSLVESHRV
jgi:hypothetical protein